MELDTSISLASSCSKLPHSQSTPAGVDGGTRTPPMTPKKGGKMLAVRVQMLNDNITIFQVQAKALGRVLFDQVCKQLNLLEADYFGLEYLEGSTRYWLDLEKPMHRQVGLTLVDPHMFFCVKFYTPDPSQLEEEYTRYLFCLQIKRDLAQGHLQCNDNTAALMASYIVQADCGDFVPEDYPDHTYLSTYKFIPHQDQELERRIMENHKKHVGQSPAEADLNLLETARRCELYGMKMHPAKDHEGVPLNLAVAHMGIVVFQNYTKINTFSWAKIRKISFKRKRFLVKLHPEGYGFYKDVVEFFFENRNDCKNLWKKCVENHGFFRCTTVKSIPRQRTRVLSRGSSFRYSGKTQKQVIEYVRENYVKRQTFKRSQSFRQSSSVHSSVANVGGSISAHPLLPLGDSAVAGTGASLSCGSMSMSGVGEKRLGVNVAEDSLSPISHRRQPGGVATSTPTIGNHVQTLGRTTKGHTSVDIHPQYIQHVSGVEKDLSTSSEVTSITSSSPQHSYTINNHSMTQEFQGQRTIYKTITPRYIHNTSPIDHYNDNDDLQSAVINQIKSHVNNNDDYYYLLSSHSSGRHNRLTNRSSQTDIVDLSPDAEEPTLRPHDLRSSREKDFEFSNRYTWQRSNSCKELNSARRKRAQELDSATYVTNPKELNISSEKHIDSPITRYNDTTKPPYQPMSIKTPSLERSDTVPETKVYSSSYPGTTSSLSTESGDQEGGLEVGGSVLIMDIGSHENLFLSHDDVSHDSYELLEREREYQEMFGGGSHSGSYGSVENLQDDLDIFQMDDLLSKSSNSVYDDVRSEIDNKIGFKPNMGFSEFNELCKENFRKSHEKIYRERLSVYSKNRSNEFREINVKVKPGEVISGFSNESNGTAPNTHSSVERTKSDPYMAHEKLKPSPPSSISSKTNASQLSLADSDTFKCHSATDIPYTLRKRADMNGTCSKPKSKPLLKNNINLKDSGLSLSGNLGSIEDNDATLNISSFESRSPQDFGSICNENSLLDRNYLSIDEPRKEIIKVKSVDSGTTKPAKPIHKIHQSRSAEGIKHKNSSFEKQDLAGNKIKVIKIDSDKCSCDSRKNSTESADAADVIIVEYRDTRKKKLGKKGSSSDNQEARSRGSSIESKDPKLSPSRTCKSASLSKISSPNKLSPNKTKPSSSPKDQLSPKALSPKQSPKQLSPKQLSPKQSKGDPKLSPNTCKVVKTLRISTPSPKSTPKTSPKTSPKLSPEVEIVPARKRPPSEKPVIKPKPKMVPKKPISGGKETTKLAETEKKSPQGEKLQISEKTVEGIKKNLLSPESPWKKFTDLNVSGKDKPPVLFGRLGLSEGSGYTPKHEALSPGASRRAKSLETPIVALHRLPPVTSFSSKDDTLADDEEEDVSAMKEKKDSDKSSTAETLKEVSDKLAETNEGSISPSYGQNAKETLKELLTLVASPVDKMSPTEVSPSLTPERRQSTRQERLDSFKKLKNFSIDIWDSGEVEALTNARRAANIDFELGDDDAFIEPEESAEQQKPQVSETAQETTDFVPEEATGDVPAERTPVETPSTEDQMVPQVKPTENLIFNYDLDNIMVESYTTEEFETFPALTTENLSPVLGREEEVEESRSNTDQVETKQEIGVIEVAVGITTEATLEQEIEKVKSEKNSLEEEEVWVSVDEYLEDDKDKIYTEDQSEPKEDVVNSGTQGEIEAIIEVVPIPIEAQDQTVVAVLTEETSQDELVKSDITEEIDTFKGETSAIQKPYEIQMNDELPSVEEDSVFDGPEEPPLPDPPVIEGSIPKVLLEKSDGPDEQSVAGASTANLPVPPIPDKRSFDDEPSTSSSGMRVGESSTWRPFPLESSGSSSLEEGLFPPDDTGHYADEEGEDGSSKDDDFPTNLNYPITSAEIMLSGFGGGVFGLSRTLSRISERSTTSEQERSDFEDDISVKQSSHSISEDDDSIISSDRPPSVSTGSASGSQADLGYDDFPPLPDLPDERSPEDESLETIKIPPPFIPSNSEENWPSPPASPPASTPMTSQVETFFIKPEEAAKVSIKLKQDDGEDSSTEENKTLQEEDMPPSVFSDSFTLVEEKPEPPRKKRNSDDTSIGFTTSDWSSSTGTTVKQHFGIAKSDDSSLAGDFGLSLSTEMLASGSKCSSRKSSDDTTPVLHVYYPLKQRSFDDYDSPYTTESDDTVSLSVAKPPAQKPFQQYYSTFNISPTKTQPKFPMKDRRTRSLGNKSPSSSRSQLDCPPTLEEIELSFERSKAKSIARAKCYSYYSLARSPPSDASSSSLELPESLTAPNTIPRVSKRRKTHPIKKRHRIVTTEINVDHPDVPSQSPKSYNTATLRKAVVSPSHSKPTTDK